MTKNKLLIFFPTLNEEKNVAPLILELRDLYGKADFLVIDDSSMDKTVLNLQNLKLDRLKILIRSENSGIGSAHREAISYAKEHNYQLLVTIDGDRTHRPVDIQLLLDQVDKHHLVVGSRFINYGSIMNWSKTRKFLTNVGHFVTKSGLGIPYDCSSGMRAYNISKNSFVDILNVRAKGYDFFYKSIFSFQKQNPDKIMEVPITLLPRASGDSKLSFSKALISIINLIFDILKFRFLKFVKH
jgi:glycosyltransferase involved in cell wall biosynthesis